MATYPFRPKVFGTGARGWFSDFWQMASYSSGTVPDLHRTCPFEPRIIPAAPPGMCRMYLSLAV